MTNGAAPVDAPADLKDYVPAPVPNLSGGSEHVVAGVSSEAVTTLPEKTKKTGLNLTIEGVRNNRGRVLVMVFSSEAAYEAYDYKNTVGYVELPAVSGVLVHGFETLTKGPYAVRIFHDENGDYELNMSGDYPLEGYTSSGATSLYDEPKFKDASVGPGNVTVQVRYIE
tara:strand:- start:102 stop:608 length:507 start_codon:yes stop_codon:yes gene_type:complete